MREYLYTAHDGTPLMKWRDDAKNFGWKHQIDDKWVSGKNGKAHRPYRIEEVLSAPIDLPVFIVEGEKCVEALQAMGLLATTRGGAKDYWTEEDAELLDGRPVLVIPDTDEPGYTLAEKTASALLGHADIVTEFVPTGYFEQETAGMDIADWRGAPEDLLREAYAALRRYGRSGARAVNGVATVYGGAELAEETAAFLRRYVSMTAEQADIVALWVMHTWCFEAFEITPYLGVTSAEKRSGKSRVLDVLQFLVRRPWRFENASDAAFFRKIAGQQPTVLFDEADKLFEHADDRPDTVAAWNGGFRKTGSVTRLEPAGRSFKSVDFPTFCPKAYAAIGDAPTTIRDRTVPVRLERKAKSDEVTKWRERRCKKSAGELAARLEEWGARAVNALRDAEPEPPPGLTDRAEDITEPLLAVADSAGAAWARRARKALQIIMLGTDASDDSMGIRLLRDCARVLDGADEIPSAQLAEELNALVDEPWSTWNHGKGIRPADLARRLKPFKICPEVLDVGEDYGANRRQARGYRRAMFEEPMERYSASGVPF